MAEGMANQLLAALAVLALVVMGLGVSGLLHSRSRRALPDRIFALSDSLRSSSSMLDIIRSRLPILCG